MSAFATPRFSQRIAWDTPPNTLSQILEARRATGQPILDLTLSNPTHAGLGDWDVALHEAFAAAPSFDYSPQPEGIASARNAVAEYYGSGRYHLAPVALDPDQIVLSASSSESYSFLFQALCDPGDEVLAPIPSYPLFEFLAGLSSVSLRSYRLRYHGEWHLDFASLEAAIGPRTRAIVVVNPNNPTGGYLRVAEQERLLSLCAERGLVLIADEVFEEYPIQLSNEVSLRNAAPSFSRPQQQAVCVSLGGLSKSAGLPQMKLGWMILNGPTDAAERLRQRLILIADTYLSVSTPVQAALPQLLNIGRDIGDSTRTRIRANYRFLKSAVRIAPHMTCLATEAGWNTVLRLPAIRSDSAWAEHLLSVCGILVQPGYFYEFEGEACLVISLLPQEMIFAEAITRLCREVEALAAI